jgi:hypothetical protein
MRRVTTPILQGIFHRHPIAKCFTMNRTRGESFKTWTCCLGMPGIMASATTNCWIGQIRKAITLAIYPSYSQTQSQSNLTKYKTTSTSHRINRNYSYKAWSLARGSITSTNLGQLRRAQLCSSRSRCHGWARQKAQLMRVFPLLWRKARRKKFRKLLKTTKSTFTKFCTRIRKWWV